MKILKINCETLFYIDICYLEYYLCNINQNQRIKKNSQQANT